MGNGLGAPDGRAAVRRGRRARRTLGRVGRVPVRARARGSEAVGNMFSVEEMTCKANGDCLPIGGVSPSKCLIYGLVDPRTKLVCYVGLSSRGLRRPKQHRVGRKDDGQLCQAWLRNLAEAGLSFDVAVLAYTTQEQLTHDERWWIAFGRACGWPLTNMNEGGSKPRELHPLTRERLRENAAKQFQSDAQRARRSEANRQRDTPEFREHLAERIRAYYATPKGLAQRERSRERMRQTARDLVAKRWPNGRQPRKSRATGKPRIVSAEQRAKLSKIARERQARPEVRAAIGARSRAALASPQARARLSEAVSKTWTPERRAAMSAHAKARQASPEVRAAIAERTKTARARRKAK